MSEVWTEICDISTELLQIWNEIYEISTNISDISIEIFEIWTLILVILTNFIVSPEISEIHLEVIEILAKSFCLHPKFSDFGSKLIDTFREIFDI